MASSGLSRRRANARQPPHTTTTTPCPPPFVTAFASSGAYQVHGWWHALAHPIMLDARHVAAPCPVHAAARTMEPSPMSARPRSALVEGRTARGDSFPIRIFILFHSRFSFYEQDVLYSARTSHLHAAPLLLLHPDPLSLGSSFFKPYLVPRGGPWTLHARYGVHLLERPCRRGVRPGPYVRFGDAKSGRCLYHAFRVHTAPMHAAAHGGKRLSLGGQGYACVDDGPASSLEAFVVLRRRLAILVLAVLLLIPLLVLVMVGASGEGELTSWKAPASASRAQWRAVEGAGRSRGARVPVETLVYARDARRASAWVPNLGSCAVRWATCGAHPRPAAREVGSAGRPARAARPLRGAGLDDLGMRPEAHLLSPAPPLRGRAWTWLFLAELSVRILRELYAEGASGRGTATRGLVEADAVRDVLVFPLMIVSMLKVLLPRDVP
ncbi:hypothetical protein C8J57DRAFT_1635701 [Mycena rebaudengoi]|nr:hypothetical protein C8J57DRAFT_1635701 [Mycena rebaudengoi]